MFVTLALIAVVWLLSERKSVVVAGAAALALASFFFHDS